MRGLLGGGDLGLSTAAAATAGLLLDLRESFILPLLLQLLLVFLPGLAKDVGTPTNPSYYRCRQAAVDKEGTGGVSGCQEGSRLTLNNLRAGRRPVQRFAGGGFVVAILVRVTLNIVLLRVAC